MLAVYFLSFHRATPWHLKQVAPLDALLLVLAGLYTIRLVAGHAATDIEYSAWLLMFSMFIFLSLALVKRYTELNPCGKNNPAGSSGRGYVVGDLEVVATFGTGSGFLSALVIALYVNSEEVNTLSASEFAAPHVSVAAVLDQPRLAPRPPRPDARDPIVSP